MFATFFFPSVFTDFIFFTFACSDFLTFVHSLVASCCCCWWWWWSWWSWWWRSRRRCNLCCLCCCLSTFIISFFLSFSCPFYFFLSFCILTVCRCLHTCSFTEVFAIINSPDYPAPRRTPSPPPGQNCGFVVLFVGCLTSQQHASVSQGRICSDNFTCCHTEIEAADHTFHLTQSQYTDTGPTSPSTDPITPGAWQGSHWSANF